MQIFQYSDFRQLDQCYAENGGFPSTAPAASNINNFESG